MGCRFCSLGESEQPRVIAELNHCVVIFSNPRLVPGHLLVIPKRHVEHLSELSKDEREEIFNTTIEYQERILKNVASGCDIKQHDRPFLPENDLKVDHLHFHLVPREFADELYQTCHRHERKLFAPLIPEEISSYSKLLI
jgi:diadenosine tetraphosphate (Ap4A) HIT family hydrolase